MNTTAKHTATQPATKPSRLALALAGIGLPLLGLSTLSYAEDAAQQITERSAGHAKITDAAALAKQAGRFTDLNTVPLVAGNSLVGEYAYYNVDAPNPAVKRITLAVDRDGIPADGQSGVTLTVQLQDAAGQLVQTDAIVTIESSLGRFKQSDRLDVIDADLIQPGHQLKLTGGQAKLILLAPSQPGDAVIRVRSNGLELSGQISFLPELRPLLLVGLAEARIGQNDIDNDNADILDRPTNDFDHGIRRFNYDIGGDTRAAGRIAFFAKGAISPSTLLTAYYDSDKQVKGRLFNDYKTEDFYPIYGDASTKTFEAQTSDRLFVRLDRGQNHLSYGDVALGTASPAQQLGAYNRTLTGVKGHLENTYASLDVLAAREDSGQVVEEYPFNGTGMIDYRTRRTDGLLNSETIRVIYRDRDTGAFHHYGEVLLRGKDYSFEPSTGAIVFAGPQSSTNATQDLSRSFQISYEVGNGGSNFWTYGLQGQVKPTAWWQIGGASFKTEDPLSPYQISSLNTTVKLGEQTQLVLEGAVSTHDGIRTGSPATSNTDQPINTGTGHAWRGEIRHDGSRIQARAYAGKADDTFYNPSGGVTADSESHGAEVKLKLTDWLGLNASAKRDKTAAGASHTQNDTQQMGVDITPTQKLKFGLGWQNTEVSTTGAAQKSGQRSLNARADYQVTDRFDLFAGYKHGTNSSREIEAGAGYRFSDVGRIYLKHTYNDGFVNGSADPLSPLNNTNGSTGSTSDTTLGIETSYMKDGTLFNEYRLRDTQSGVDNQAVIGLRNLWHIGEGLGLTTNFERTQSLRNTTATKTTGTAFSANLNYTGSERFKSQYRFDWRNDANARSFAMQVDTTIKLSRDWSFIEKAQGAHTRNKAGTSTTTPSTTRSGELALGLAYRNVDTNRHNVLGLYRYRFDNSGIKERVHVLSFHGDYHPSRPWMLNWQYGFKRNAGQYENNTNDRFMGHILAGRILYDVTEKIDLGLTAGVLASKASKDSHGYSNTHALGLEAGYLLMENLWLSAGYNFRGLNDKDLTSSDYLAQGPYLRIRFKFDQDTFRAGNYKANKVVVPPEGSYDLKPGEKPNLIEGAH